MTSRRSLSLSLFGVYEETTRHFQIFYSASGFFFSNSIEKAFFLLGDFWTLKKRVLIYASILVFVLPLFHNDSLSQKNMPTDSLWLQSEPVLLTPSAHLCLSVLKSFLSTFCIKPTHTHTIDSNTHTHCTKAH